MIMIFKYNILSLFFLFTQFLGAGQSIHTTEKINGVCLVNPPNPVKLSTIESVKRVKANWVAIIPYSFSRQNEPEVHFNKQRQWWGEKVDGTKELIKMANNCKLEVMLKPHVWLVGGFIGDFDLLSEDDWKKWEESYENYIMTFAKVSEELQVPMLCIGTEIKRAAVKREQFWRELIGKIKSVYGGELTYAANWDNYKEVKFWDALDYIGVDAYFPLTQEVNPKIEDIDNGWVTIKADLNNLSAKYNKPILFTEYGYQSLNGAAGNHWEVTKSHDNLNHEIQSMAYESLYCAFWDESWVAGGFLWKWHLKPDAGGLDNIKFTPQGKPVEEVIKKWYKD